MPELQKVISSRHFAELMIYDKLYGIPDAMQLERMVAGAVGVKNYKRPPATGDAFAQLKTRAK